MFAHVLIGKIKNCFESFPDHPCPILIIKNGKIKAIAMFQLSFLKLSLCFDDIVLQGTIMEEMDFERRRELRRQKREEMRLEAER